MCRQLRFQSIRKLFNGHSRHFSDDGEKLTTHSNTTKQQAGDPKEAWQDDNKVSQADHDTGFANMDVQKQATKYAKGIKAGLENGDRRQVFKNLQFLRRIAITRVSDPKRVFDDLVDAITCKAIAWEDYGIKRHIAYEMRRFAHAMYHVAKWDRNKIYGKEEKKETLKRLKTVLDLIDESQAPGNGLRLELDTVAAMLDAMPDTDSGWDILGDSVLGLYKFTKEKDIAELAYLAKTIYGQIKKSYNREWYEVVLLIDYLKEEALNDEKALRELQTLLYVYKQKRDIQRINIWDARGDWHILCAGIDALHYVVTHITKETIREQAFESDNKEQPGINYYLDFNKYSILGIKSNWRIREKAVESMIRLAHQKNNEHIAQKAKQFLLTCRMKEQDKRVLFTLEKPQTITAIEEALTKDWTQYKTGFDKILSDHTQTMQAMMLDLWEKQKERQAKLFEEQKNLLEEIRENIQGNNVEELKEFIQSNQEAFLAQLAMQMQNNAGGNQALVNQKKLEEYFAIVEENANTKLEDLTSLLKILAQTQQEEMQKQVMHMREWKKIWKQDQATCQKKLQEQQNMLEKIQAALNKNDNNDVQQFIRENKEVLLADISALHDEALYKLQNRLEEKENGMHARMKEELDTFYNMLQRDLVNKAEDVKKILQYTQQAHRAEIKAQQAYSGKLLKQIEATTQFSKTCQEELTSLNAWTKVFTKQFEARMQALQQAISTPRTINNHTTIVNNITYNYENSAPIQLIRTLKKKREEERNKDQEVVQGLSLYVPLQAARQPVVELAEANKEHTLHALDDYLVRFLGIPHHKTVEERKKRLKLSFESRAQKLAFAMLVHDKQVATESDIIEKKEKHKNEDSKGGYIDLENGEEHNRAMERLLASKLLLLQGNPGAGKSLYGCHLEEMVWKKRDSEATDYIPLFIYFRKYDKPNKNIITEVLASYGIKGKGLDELKKANTKFFFIFDGFDEIKAQYEEAAGKTNFYEYFQLDQWPESKFMVSCRDLDSIAIFKVGSAFSPEVHIAPFSPSQIDDYIEIFATSKYNKVKTWNADTYRTALANFTDLKEMVREPLLLRLTLTVLEKLASDYGTSAHINRTQLYRAFIDAWFENEVNKLEKAGKLGNWNEAQANQNNKSKMRLQGSPLRRVGEKEYMFIHKSYQEFFAATKIVAEILSRGKLQGYKNYVAAHGEGYALNQKLLMEEVPILRFIGEQLQKEDAQGHTLEDYLWKVILASKKNPKLAMAANNSMTILNAANISFNGRDLSGIHASVQFKGKWQGPNLVAGLFHRTKFCGADLQGTFWGNACLLEANLTNAKLEGASFGMPLRTLKKHISKVHSVAFSPDGQTLAFGSSDGLVKVWDTNTWKYLRKLKGHEKGVTSVVFSPDGTTLASASDDDTIKIWNPATKTCLRTLKKHTGEVCGVAFSPDGTTLASAGGKYDKPGEIKVWDTKTWKCLRTLKGHEKGVTSVVFSPDGTTLASASFDKSVKVWDLATGKCLRTLKGHTDGVNNVAFSSDGTTLASASHDKSVKVWDLTTGTCLHTLKGHIGTVWSVAFSPDGKTIASASDDKSVKVWNAATGNCLRTLQGHRGIVKSVAFSLDGTTLTSASDDKSVKVWDTAAGNCLRMLTGHRRRVKSVAFSAHGQTLASASSDDTIKLWDPATGTCLRTLQGHENEVNSVAFAPDGTTLASAGGKEANWKGKDGYGEIKIWDTAKGTCLRTLQGHTNYVRSVAFAPDGTTLASASKDNTIKLWDLATGNCLRTMTGHTKWVRSVAFASDGTTLASASDDATIKIWDRATGNCLRTMTGHTDDVRSVAFSPDGKIIASASDDNTIRIWDLATGSCMRSLPGHTSGVNSVAFSPDGQTLASGSGNVFNSKPGEIKIWDTTTGTCLRTLLGHTSSVNSVAFSPDGTTLASASDDKSVKVWDVKTGNLLYNLHDSHQQVLNLHGTIIKDTTGIDVDAFIERGAVLEAKEEQKVQKDVQEEKNDM